MLDLKPQDETEFVKNSGWPDDPLANLIEAEPDLEDPNAAEDPDRKPIIVIDAGHGGVDPGASGTNGVQEKEVVLQAAVALRDLIIDSGRYDVILTRDSDVFLGLRERVAIARRAKADLFISLHADSIDKPSIRGASVYTLSERLRTRKPRRWRSPRTRTSSRARTCRKSQATCAASSSTSPSAKPRTSRPASRRR